MYPGKESSRRFWYLPRPLKKKNQSNPSENDKHQDHPHQPRMKLKYIAARFAMRREEGQEKGSTQKIDLLLTLRTFHSAHPLSILNRMAENHGTLIEYIFAVLHYMNARPLEKN
jgi:hypothetical protein